MPPPFAKSMLAAIAECIAGREHIGAGKKYPGIAVGVSVVGMGELRDPAADFHFLGTPDVGVGRQCFRGSGRCFVAGEAVRGASGKSDADVILRDNGRAILVEQRISAGVVAVKMGVDKILDG
jgi:hypothetical protein